MRWEEQDETKKIESSKFQEFQIKKVWAVVARMDRRRVLERRIGMFGSTRVEALVKRKEKNSNTAYISEQVENLTRKAIHHLATSDEMWDLKGTIGELSILQSTHDFKNFRALFDGDIFFQLCNNVYYFVVLGFCYRWNR